MPPNKRPRAPLDLSPRQAAFRAVLSWISGVAVLVILLTALVVGAGWVLTTAQPLRWVVQQGVLPMLSWMGYGDIETSVQDVTWDWITLGPTRFEQQATFERAEISLNPLSPYFAQATLWGARLSVAEKDDGWALTPLADSPLPQARAETHRHPDLPNRADATSWWHAPSRLPITLHLLDSHLTLSPLPLAEGAEAPVIQAHVNALQIQGAASNLIAGDKATGSLDATLSGSAAAAFGLAQSEVEQDAPLALSLAGGWMWQNQQIILPTPQMSATLGPGFAGVGWGLPQGLAVKATPLPATPSATQPPDPMIRVILPQDQGPQAITTLLPHLRLEVDQNRVGLGEDAPLELGSLKIAVSGIMTFGETVPAVVRELSMGFENTSLSVAGARLKDITATIDVETDRPQISASAQVVSLPGIDPKGTANKAAYPLQLSLTAAVDAESAQPLAETPIPFTLRLESASGLSLLSAQGSSLLIENSGQAHLRLEPLQFSPDGLQPEHLLPMLGGTVSETSGRLSGSGQVSWKDGTIHPDISIALDKVSLRHGFLSLEDMTGVIRLTGFSPLRTPKGQEIAIARLQAGLPLANALATYHLDGKGGLVIERASLSLAKGTLGLENSRVTLSPLGGDLPLTVTGLDLGALASYGELDGLTASGTLSGTIPLRLTSSDIIIDHGSLISQHPGSVRYRPDNPPAALQTGGSVDLLMRALDDFHYETLKLSLNGSASGDLEAGLHLKGANPALYDGFPIELNLSLSGALSQLVANTVQTTRVPEHLQKRVEEIMKAPSQ